MDWEAAAHTAEHAFMGALSTLIKVKPLKVEHKGMVGTITLEAEELGWLQVAKAVAQANKIIFEGRNVREYEFESIKEARKTFPGLRAHERVSGKVRVVEIEGYDYAACIRRHVKNTAEARLFLVKDMRSKRRGLYEIEFLVGPAAAEYIMTLEEQVGLSAKELVCKPWELYQRVRWLKEAKERMEREKAKLTKQLAKAQMPMVIGDVEVYSGVVEGVEEKRFMEDITKRLRKGMAAYAIVSGDRCKVFVVQRDLDIDCSQALKEAVKKYGGGGGGRKDFAMGAVPRDFAESVIGEILKYYGFHL